MSASCGNNGSEKPGIQTGGTGLDLRTQTTGGTQAIGTSQSEPAGYGGSNSDAAGNTAIGGQGAASGGQPSFGGTTGDGLTGGAASGVTGAVDGGGANSGGGSSGSTHGSGTGGTSVGGPNTGGATAGSTNINVTNTGGTNTGGTNMGGANAGGSVKLGGASSGGANTGGSAKLGGASSGGAPATGGSSTVSAIRIDDFADYQVIQRAIHQMSQTVRVSGSYTGSTASAIEASIVDYSNAKTAILPWAVITSSPNGAFAGSLEVPQGGWYRLALRAIDNNQVEIASALGSHRWGVGINILLIGQSNMVGNGNVQNFTSVTSDLAALYSNDNAWKHLADPYDGGGLSSEVDYDSWIGASLVPSLANALTATYAGIPIGFVPAARGSSPLHGTDAISWVNRTEDNHADSTNLYGNSLTNVRAAGGVELVVMHQGETDATNVTPKDQYIADLKTLLAHYREDIYATIPLFFCQIGRSTSDIPSKNRTDANMQAIRSAQHDADDGTNMFLAALAIDLNIDTSAADHYTKAGHDILGPRIANAINYYYGASNYYRGPETVSVSYANAKRDSIDVVMRHSGGTDFAPATGINGFQVLDDGTPVTPTSVTREDSTTISIVLAQPIAGVGSVRYLYGKLNSSTLTGAVHDNSPLQLPLEPFAQDWVLP